MPDLTPVDEIRAARAVLTSSPPPFLAGATARLIQSDSEGMDAVAWCARPDHEPDTECDRCHTIELHSEWLAALVVALFNARKPLARLLEIHTEICHGDGCTTLDVARALLGEAADA